MASPDHMNLPAYTSEVEMAHAEFRDAVGRAADQLSKRMSMAREAFYGSDSELRAVELHPADTRNG